MAGSMESNEDFSRQISPSRAHHHHRNPNMLTSAGHPHGENPVETGGGSGHIPAGSQRLDFHDVMTRLRSMFPLDSEVIEAVLRANKGDVDAAVNDLLAMCTEEGVQPNGRLMAGVAGPRGRGVKEMPPSYEQAVSMSGRVGAAGSGTEASWSGGEMVRPQQPRMGAAAVVGASGGAVRGGEDAAADLSHTPRPLPGLPSRDSPRSSASGVSGTSSSHARYRIWKPPLLGTLPDDFLRIVSLPSSTANTSATVSNTSVAMVPHSQQQQIHTSRRACLSCGRHHTSGQQRSVKPPGGGTGESQVVATGAGAGELVTVVTCNNPQHNHHHHRHHQQPAGVVASSAGPGHQNSVGRVGELLQKRLEANLEQQRRASQNSDIDPEVVQYLDDERIALMLQNEEFLRMLRHDDDFMRALQRDRLNNVQQQREQQSLSSSSGGSGHISSRASGSPRSDTDGATGGPTRGDLVLPNSAASLDLPTIDETGVPFPYTRDLTKETDEDLRSQLQEMGGFSRKRFAALAKRFFSVRYKKKPAQTPFYKTELPTESTMNLLEDDETDRENRLTRAVVDQERRTREDTIEFEAWPSALPSQTRNAHNPDDGISTTSPAIRHEAFREGY